MEKHMLKTGWLLGLLIVLSPMELMAETVTGTLDAVSFHKETIRVDGVTFDVNTEATRVLYRSEVLGEEDLRPGDKVELHMGNRRGGSEKRVLELIILIRGSKSGLDS